MDQSEGQFCANFLYAHSTKIVFECTKYNYILLQRDTLVKIILFIDQNVLWTIINTLCCVMH